MSASKGKITVLAEWKAQGRRRQDDRATRPQTRLKWPSFYGGKKTPRWIGSIPLDLDRHIIIYRVLGNKMLEVAGVPAPKNEVDARRYYTTLARDGWAPYFAEDDESPQVFEGWDPNNPLASFIEILESCNGLPASISKILVTIILVTLPFATAAVPQPPIPIRR